MRFCTCLLVTACLCASMIRAQDQPKFSPAQQEVLDAHKARAEASEKRDYMTYSRLVADDCMSSNDNGVLITNPKGAYDGALEAPPRVRPRSESA